MLVALSFPLALSVVETILPFYDRILARHLQLNYVDNWRLFLGFGAITILVGLLSGTIPRSFCQG